jgi:hypothetical protein
MVELKSDGGYGVIGLEAGERSPQNVCPDTLKSNAENHLAPFCPPSLQGTHEVTPKDSLVWVSRSALC